MIKDHRISWIVGVCFRQHLNTPSVGIRLVKVQFDDGETDQSPNALRIQVDGALKSKLRFFRVVELEEAVAHAETNDARALRIRSQSFFVERESAAVIFLVE